MAISRRRAAMLSPAFVMETLVFPSSVLADPDGPTPLGPDDREELARYARDTWRSLDEMTWPDGLPADHLCRYTEETWTPSPRTSPTDIAAYFWSILAAKDLRIIDPAGALGRLEKTLSALARLERHRGFVSLQRTPAILAGSDGSWPVLIHTPADAVYSDGVSSGSQAGGPQ